MVNKKAHLIFLSMYDYKSVKTLFLTSIDIMLSRLFLQYIQIIFDSNATMLFEQKFKIKF